MVSSGENLFLNIPRKDVRISREWVGGQWIDVQPKPDILSAIFTDISQGSKVSLSSTITKDVKSEDASMANVQISTNSPHETECGEKPILTGSSNSDSLPENEKLVNDALLPSSKDKSAIDDSTDASDRPEILGDNQGSGFDDDKDEQADDKRDKVDMEITETPKQNCNAIETMETEA